MARPQDRYADGRESAKIILALAHDALTIAEIALRAAKPIDVTKSHVHVLRHKGQITIDRREWREVPYRGMERRKRYVAYYKRSANSGLIMRPATGGEQESIESIGVNRGAA